ncbi:MAG: CoB--CoM heterodisulfide reductase iron-sulfur subunit A family protein, partial [Candidatus Cloacimonetes bacterium]|nr:CoB--CoM heterodisulfide reductase iron-sulfur subunit A family protein [Candidatus Cloacimonadota bacterium]
NVQNEDQKNEIKVGAIVVATGFDLFNPEKIPRYGYGKFEDVYTSMEIEEMNSKTGKILLKSGKSPKSAALIHCVGREEKGYCSRVCCNYMFKIAQYLKEKLSDIKITEFYQDLCLPNKADQEFFIDTKNKGIDFIRIKDIAVKQNDKEKFIEYTRMDGKKAKISAEIVILAPAIEPTKGTADLAELLNIPLDETGFFQEEHQKLNPISTSMDGIFIVGSAQNPKNIPDSIMDAQAVDGKILTQLIPGEKLVPEVKVSEISEAFCTGCQICLSVCSYGAIYFDEDRNISVVNEAICRGCGNCVASCPSGAAHSKHFTSPQLYQEVIEAIR